MVPRFASSSGPKNHYCLVIWSVKLSSTFQGRQLYSDTLCLEQSSVDLVCFLPVLRSRLSIGDWLTAYDRGRYLSERLIHSTQIECAKLLPDCFELSGISLSRCASSQWWLGRLTLSGDCTELSSLSQG